MMDNLLRDIRYAVRTLAGSPGFTAIAVIALALGIGANTAIFSVVNAVLLRPLPFRSAGELVQIWGSSPARGVPFHNVTYSDVSDWRKQSRSFVSMAACASGFTNLTLREEPERLSLWRVNASFFPMLGVGVHSGRGFLPDEDRPGAPRVVLLSYELWQRRFGSDPKCLGSSILLDGVAHEVVGVLPEAYRFPAREVDLYTPLALNDAREERSDAATVVAFARLGPGVTVARAQAEMNSIGRRLAEHRRSLGTEPRVWGLRDFIVRDIRLSLVVLSAAVALVLLIACANVANLLLARAGSRRRELAVRVAMGAGRSRILGQLLTESAILSLAGGAGGSVLAWWGVRGLVLLVPERYALIHEASIDLPVLAFTLFVSLATGVIFGLAPALALSRSRTLHDALKEGSRGSGETPARVRLRSALVVTEVALALLLLVGAGLLIRSFIGLNRLDPGFNSKQVLTAGLTLSPSRYEKTSQRTVFFQRLFQELSATPGVVAAGASSSLPLSGHNSGTGLIVEGRPIPRPGEIPIVWFRIVNNDYFRAMEIPLREGRNFTDQDQSGPPVAVINETMARRHWPNEKALGKRFTNSIPQPGSPVTWITVIGIAGDLRHRALTEEPDAEVFWPYQQHAPAALTLAVRVAGSDAASFAPVLRQTIASLDKELPASRIRTIEDLRSGSIAAQRLSVTLLGIFAGLALVLAAVGIYGVISFSVTQRTHEIGVRIALGARARSVVGMVVAQALIPAAAGVGIGLAASLASTRFLGSLLYGVSATDPAVLGLVSALLIAISAAAGCIPARRAARVDPTVALRYE